jgi:hypothetical protein
MHLKHFVFALAVAAVAIGSSACSTPTTIAETWRDPNYSAAPLRKVLILARVRGEANRRSLEDAYAAALSQHGVQAMPSYRVFQQPNPDREAVRQYLTSEGYDGALVSRFEGTQTATRVVPGSDFGWYYGGYWGSDYYLETDVTVKVETSLWDPRTGKLIWSAASETENPSSSADAISSLVSKITSSLTNARLIPPAGGPAVSYVPRERAY